MNLTPTQQRITATICAALLFALVIHFLQPILMPFVMALGLSYLLSPWVGFIEKYAGRWVPRALAVVLVQLMFMVLFFSILFLLAPIFVKELPVLRDQLPLALLRLQDQLLPVMNSLGIEARFDVQSIKELVMKYFDTSWDDLLSTALASLKIGGSVILTLVGNAVLIPLIMFYFLLDQHLILERIKQWIPLKQSKHVELFLQEVDHLLGQFIRGQLSVMVCMAIFYVCALKMAGLSLALPIGIFTGLAIFIPYIGIGFGLLLALMSSMLEFEPTHALSIVALVFGIGQVLEGFFLTPKLVGERIGLHPVVVIFALLAAGQIFGFVGVMLALPMSAILSVALAWFKRAYQASHLYHGESGT
jgi:predicted PurR-regulated permease PerM